MYHHTIEYKSYNDISDHFKSIIKELTEYFDMNSPIETDGDIKNYIVFQTKSSIDNLDEITMKEINGVASIGFYSNKSLGRPSCWHFGTNIDRSCWIGFIGTIEKNKGYGTNLLKEVEKIAFNNRQLLDKKNIYAAIVKRSSRFYYRNGYDEILVKDHKDDEDYPHVFRAELLLIYAKNINGTFIDRETPWFEFETEYIDYFRDAVILERKTALEEYYQLSEVEFEKMITNVTSDKDYVEYIIKLVSKHITSPYNQHIRQRFLERLQKMLNADSH